MTISFELSQIGAVIPLRDVAHLDVKHKAYSGQTTDFQICRQWQEAHLAVYLLKLETVGTSERRRLLDDIKVKPDNHLLEKTPYLES